MCSDQEGGRFGKASRLPPLQKTHDDTLSYSDRSKIGRSPLKHKVPPFHTSTPVMCQLRVPRVTLKCGYSQFSAQRGKQIQHLGCSPLEGSSRCWLVERRCRGKLDHSGGAPRVCRECSEHAIICILLSVLGISANTLTPRKNPSRHVLCKCPDHHVEP